MAKGLRRCASCKRRIKIAWFPWDGNVCAPCINTGEAVVVKNDSSGVEIALRPKIHSIVAKGTVSAS